MAINNTDNPEEGTPRDKKDIRRERRQMRAINAYRAKLGEKDPYYTKEEIREVGKPFKAQSSTFMTGTKDGTTYNDPNKPSEPDYEYKIYETGGPGVSATTITAPVTKEQFQALTSDNPKEGEVVRQAILSKAYSDPNATPSTIKTAQGIADAAKNETDNLVNKIETEIKDEVELKDKVGGSGETINPIVNGVDPNATNWVNVTKYKDGYQLPSDEDIYTRANLAKKKAPQLVVEKLGVQDYYPEIGKDIAVGTFSGSRIGSQTIYSGAGGLLPLGLYDARKRAIAAEIKRKEALMSELSEIPDISKQFQPYFSGQYVEGLNKFVNAYKDNPDGLMNDPEFRKFQAHYKSIGENFLKVSDDLKEFEKLIQPGDKGADKGGYGSYATPGMLEILYKFKSGFLPDKIEDWFSGKKNISTLTETVRALPNGYKIIGEKINDLLKTNQIERTIKPKTGEEIDWNKARDEINSIAQQVNDGSSDYESYLSVVKKYYDIDVKPLVEQFVNGNSLGALTDKEKEEYIKSLTLYAEAQIPAESMISKIDRANNDNAERLGDQLNYKARMADISAQNWRFKQEMEKHNSATFAQIQAMEQAGISETALGIADPKITTKNPNELEYQVWYQRPTGKWEQGFVSYGELLKRDNMYFTSPNGTGSEFKPSATTYFGADQNVIKKEGKNYNGQRYGNVYQSQTIDGETQYTPSVYARDRKTTIVQDGKRISGAEASYNQSAGQNPAWTAADLEGRGGETSQSQGGGLLNKTGN